MAGDFTQEIERFLLQMMGNTVKWAEPLRIGKGY